MTSDIQALKDIARANDWTFCAVCNKPFKVRTFIGEQGKPWYGGSGGVRLHSTDEYDESYCKRCLISSYDYLRGDSDQWRSRNYRQWVDIIIAWVTKGNAMDAHKLPHWESTWFQEEIRRRTR
jgi:hypothetical protein